MIAVSPPTSALAPSVEVTPAHEHELERVAGVLRRFGPPAAGAPGSVRVQLEAGAEALADVVRALDDERLRVRNLELHQPSLADVFLSKTGHAAEAEGALAPLAV